MDRPQYRKRKQTTGVGGQFNEIKLSMLFLILGLEAVKKKVIKCFHMGSNVFSADDFDDIVFRYERDSTVQAILLQAKNKERPDKKNITLEKLFSDGMEKDYNLKFYYAAYRRVAAHFSTIEDPVLAGLFDRCRFVFFTNSKYNESPRGKFQTMDLPADEIFNFPTPSIAKDKFRIELNDSVYDALKYPVQFHEIVHELVYLIARNTTIDLKRAAFKTYYSYLETHVFDRTGSTVVFKRDFVDGRTEPGEELPNHLLLLRDEVFKQAEKSSDLKKHLKVAGKSIGRQVLVAHMKSKIMTFQMNFDERCAFEYNVPPTELDKELIDKFINNLHIYFNQPNEVEWDKIIKNKIKCLYGVSDRDADLIYCYVYYRVQNWWKSERPMDAENTDGEVVADYLTERDDWYAEAKLNIAKLKLVGTGVLNFAKAHSLGLNFKESAMSELADIIHRHRVITINTNDETTLLNSAKLYQTLESMDAYKSNGYDIKYIYLTGESLLLLKDVALDAFRDKNNLLVVELGREAGRFDDFAKVLGDVMADNREKKIVLLTSDNRSDLFTDLDGERCALDESRIGIDQLNEESQEMLMNKSVVFQGNRVRFGAILAGEVGSIVCGRALMHLLRGDVEIGRPLQDLGEVVDYHIDRKLTRTVRVAGGILRAPDKVAIGGLTRNEFESNYSYTGKLFDFNYGEFDPVDQLVAYKIFILGDGDPMGDYRRVGERYRDEVVHCLDSKSNGLVWIMSSGGLGTLKKYMLEEHAEDCEPNDVSHAHGKVAIVSGEPGLGKTTLLSSLAHRQIDLERPVWRGRINLLDHYGKLKHLTGESEEVFLFVCDTLELDDGWKRELFRHYYKVVGRVDLLFDGFDEITPILKRRVLALLKTLLDESKAEKMWITSRLYVIEDLENGMSSLAHKLKPFTEDDCVIFLLKFWEKTLKIEQFDGGIARDIIGDFLGEFSKRIHDEIKEFISIPLQLKMLAEVYGESFKIHYFKSRQGMRVDVRSIFDDGHLNIYILYDKFLYKKYYDILVAEKEKMDVDNPIHGNTLRGGFLNFKSIHKKYALLALFDTDLLLQLITKEEIYHIKRSINDINAGREKSGIIVKAADEKPIFSHRTFPEFFVATLLIDMLESGENYKKIELFLINMEIFSTHRFIIRLFFDFAAIHDDNAEEMSAACAFLNAAITNNRDDITKIMDGIETKTELINCRDKAGRAALHMASSYGHRELVKWLIANGADVFAEDKLFRWTPISYADKSSHWNVVELLLEEGANPNHMFEAMKTMKKYKLGDRSIKLLHTAVSIGLPRLVEALIKANPTTVNAPDIGDYNKTPLHIASGKGHVNLITFLVSRKANAYATDDEGYTPLHDAVHHNRLKSVEELIRLRPKCVNAADRLRRSPLHVAAEMGHVRVAEVLLENGARVDVTSNLTYGVDTSRSSKWTPLHVACFKGHRRVVELLLKYGARTDVRDKPTRLTPLDLTIFNLELIEMLAPDDEVMLFHNAVIRNDLKAVKDQLEDHPERTRLLESMVANWSPLHRAAFGGFEAMAKLLLVYGADVNHRRTDGFTPLNAASSNDRLGVVKILMEYSADPLLANDDGWTALHGAAQNGSMDVLAYYLSEKFRDRRWIDVVDLKGDSLLHTAAFHGKRDAVKLLLDRGADHRAVDMIGATIVMSAAITHKIQILKMLIDRGVQIDSDDREFFLGIMEFSVVHLMAAYDDVETLDYLIKDKGLDIDVGKGIGLTPLYVATLFNSSAAINYLIKENANLNVYVNIAKVLGNVKEIVKHYKRKKSILYQPMNKYFVYFKTILRPLPNISLVVLYKGLGYHDNDTFQRMYSDISFFDTFLVKVINLIFNIDYIRKQLDNSRKMIRQFKTGQNADVDGDFIPFESNWKPRIHRYVYILYIIIAVFICTFLYKWLVKTGRY